MKHFTKYAGIISLCLFVLTGCGSSNNKEEREQEIRDSIQLENDRNDLLERANRLLDSDTTAKEQQTEEETP